MKYLQKLIQNKTVQSVVKARVSTKVWAVIVALVASLGLATEPVTEYVTEITTEGVKAEIAEHGGGFIQDLYIEEVADTGLVEEDIEVAQGTTPFNANNLPHWNDVKDDDDWRYNRWQEYGTCVYETINITTIQALRLKGLWNKDDNIALDITHAYFDKVYNPGKNDGEVPDWAYEKYRDEGLPIETTYQFQRSDTVAFADALRDKKEDVYNYLIKPPYKKISEGNGADAFFTEYKRLLDQGKTPLFEISIRNLNNVKWYGVETPYVKSNTYDPRGGGHRLAGNAFYGMFEYKGEPTIVVHESESRGGVDRHIARLSVLRQNMTSWDIYEIDDSKVVVSPIPTENDPLAEETIRFRDSGEYVAALQDYLIESDIVIPAGATGYFGNQTKSALNQWQDRQFGNLYDGTVWGSISRERYIILNN